MTTFVLIHGAYQGGWIWKPTVEQLLAKGHRVFAPTLDGLGVDGKGGHTHYEQIYVSSVAPRSKLFYRLFETLQ